MATKRQLLWADLSLFVIALAWGYTFILSKDLLMELTPYYFLGTRFLIAALILLPFIWRRLQALPREVWLQGIGCGVVLCAAFTLQLLGIERTTPGKAGVITGTNVILVPFLYFLWRRKSVGKGAIIGSVLAFLGLACLSGEGDWTGLSSGDLLVFLCAIFFAMHILMVDRFYEKKADVNSLSFVMIQLLVVGVIDLVIALFSEPVPHGLSPYGWFAYWFDCLLGTLLAYVVQIKAQQFSPPVHVSIILSLEAAFAFLFSWLLWGEIVTPTILAGVFLLLAGIYITELSDQRT
ncbi:DMT family transporter [Brevibacillus centrosporus]|uniref:DMT family transporter n=1 Tax=Brevibacillus centrosporus TaxID=54910 RepID=UPI000F0A5FD2|nr:DMT family transporter [Brevibacillus centrosporus]MEC2132767.1 DMT family transporter [Brevibacillus centrosporus]RNB66566.1 DMT family transporter [Brevibacillus centrosporus]GED33040.1 transporter [Brevibacillus centrosporus]